MLSEEGTPPDTSPPVVIVQTSIEGRVLNELLQPVQGAAVSGGSQYTVTDANGHFLLEDINVPDDAAIVTVEKNGYFKAYRTLMVRQNQIQYVQLQLLLENENTFNAANGALIPFPEGTITVPADAVLMEGDQPYTDNVIIRSIYLNPADVMIPDQMPGDLRGIDRNNRQHGLRPFSMFVFTMEDRAGIALHPNRAKPATIRIMIPNDLTSGAPQLVTAWHFDEATGFWKEAGQASRHGDDYVFSADQSGYWLCATTLPLVTLTAHVKQQQDAAVSNMRVAIFTRPDLTPVFGFTNAAGTYYGKVPSNTRLLFTLVDDCADVLRQQEIGPFAFDSEISDIRITLPESQTLTINGTAKDCDDFIVGNGKVIVNVDNRSYATLISGGKFSLNIFRCNSQPTAVTFTATDILRNKTSVTTITANSGIITPELEICQ